MTKRVALVTGGVGELGRTTEIGAVVGFLASEDASYVTGANFSVNGGHHMH